MRSVPGLIVAVVVLALAGCGGGSGEEEAVKQVIADFSSAMKEKDTKTACSLMTSRARDQLLEEVGKQLSADSCEKTLNVVMAYDSEFADLFGGEATNVEITGSNGRAEVGDTTATMIKEGGAWKIDVDAGS